MHAAEPEPLEDRVLVLAPAGRDAALACQVLSDAGIAADALSGVAELCTGVTRGPGAVLLTEEVLQPKAIGSIAAALSDQPPWSDVPVLVFSAGGEHRDYAAVARRSIGALANVIFLDRPTRRVALLSAVFAALRARRRQYEVRDLLLELEQGVRDRDHFLAMLGHELRNPLGAILASIQLMERKGSIIDGERAVILRQTRLLSRLVDDLLDVSRVTSGKIALDRSRVDLGELVARSIASHASQAGEGGVAVSLTAEEPLVVEGDLVRLEQVVHNLLTNALKYTPPGGRVNVRLSRRGEDAELRMEDTGVGMDPEILPRVFDLFTQADNTLDRAHGGLGIGLTLVRSLVELHGGTVRAESEGRGRGSTFVVHLPAAAASSLPGDVSEPMPPIEPRRILLVEDNKDVRESLRALLEDAGHRVSTAGDGFEGVERGVADRPEVALVDIGLPGLDGYSVGRRLRDRLGSTVYLVALTGYGLPEDRRRAIESGFDAHLTKPVTLRSVLQLLAGAAARS
jgi:signal transduction histidine kinase/CheY-like chemotaxis protein